MRLNPYARFLLAALLAASLIGFLWVVKDRSSGEGATGEFAVEVIGPDGLVYNGSVNVTQANALRVLLAAGEKGGFDVELDEFGGFGECGDYVRSIAGHEASGAAGWVYEVGKDGEWTRPPRASSCQSLEDGDSVRWLWVTHE